MVWPPDFVAEEKRRGYIRQIIKSTKNPRQYCSKIYSNDPARFINDWSITYDPRNSSRKDANGQKLPLKMPFMLFKRQVELVEFLRSCIEDEESGLIEKARDMGATWVCCAFSVWLWLYGNGSAIGWGSRKQELVDRIGDPKSIFDKMRKIIDELPSYILPVGYDRKKHTGFMKIVNQDNDGSITGEAGDNIGRGGRTSIYFLDEAAHLERPELIEAALGDNTDVKIDISSVNGPGNVFYRARHSGAVRVFIMDWSDHPGKTQSWYDKRKEKAESMGLTHLFSQEIDRDYTSAVEGVLIPGAWVVASVDAHKKLGFGPEGSKIAGFDVMDQGGDLNSVVILHGSVVAHVKSWGGSLNTDPMDHTITAIDECEPFGVEEIRYDSVGVGAGARAAAKRVKTKIRMIAYTGAGKVYKPDRIYALGKTNGNMFANAKAQDWWRLRDRFLATYNAIVKGKEVDYSELISIPSDLPRRFELMAQLSQVTKDKTTAGKIIIDKTPDGVKSPDDADALVMANAFPGRSNNRLAGW